MRTVVIVLGMHRSGTSSIAGALTKVGVSPPKTPLGPEPSNPRGHWESAPITQFHEDLLTSAGSRWDDWREFPADWHRSDVAAEFQRRAIELLASEFGSDPIFIFKDPRVCRFASFWLDIFRKQELVPCIILPIRSPMEVALSHQKRDGFVLRKGLLLWLRHVLDAEAASRGMTRCVLEWDSFLGDWRSAFLRVSRDTGVHWPALTDFTAIEVDRFLDQDLKHQRVVDRELREHSAMHAWVSDAYHALRDLARGENLKAAYPRLDAIRAQFNDASRLMGGLLADGELAQTKISNELRSLQLELSGERERSAQVQKAQDESVRREALAQAQMENLQDQLTTFRVENEQRIQALDAQLAAEGEARALLAETKSALAGVRDELGSTQKKLNDEVSARQGVSAQLVAVNEELQVTLSRLRDGLQSTEMLQQQNEALNAMRESLLAEGQKRDADAQAQKQRFSDVLSAYNKSLAQSADLRKRLDDLTFVAEAAERARLDLSRREENTKQAAAILHHKYQTSTSWKLTSPLRSVRRAQRRLQRLFRLVPMAARVGGGPFKTIQRAAGIYRRQGTAGIRRRLRSLAARTPADEDGSSFAPSLRRLEQLRPLSTIVSEWRTVSRASRISADRAVHIITKAGRTRAVSISFSQDDYTRNIGGLQLCVQIEQHAAQQQGITYVNLHPARPLPVLAKKVEPKAFVYCMVVNGEIKGTIDGEALVAAVAKLRAAGCSFTNFVHSLLGHAPEIVAAIITAAGGNGRFWVHDYFAICPNFNLLRNSVSYCGAPPANSNSCAICQFGQARSEHLPRIAEFFETVSLDVVSPSHAALELWLSRAKLRIHSASVVPHTTEAATSLVTHLRRSDAPVRVAFLGHAAHHKGWPVFVSLTNKLRGDSRYELFHLGQGAARLANVRFVEVTASMREPDAMSQAILKHQIDLVLLWSIWPETYSLTMHEAIAAGARILTCAMSGNIRATVESGGKGRVYSSEAELFDDFLSGRILKDVSEFGQQRRTAVELAHSSMSYECSPVRMAAQ